MKSRESLKSTLTSKLENLDEMDKFLDAYNQPKLNQEDINHINNVITCNEIEGVINSLSIKKSLGSDGFMAEFNQTFKTN
jgi:hypothetical protein